MGVGFGLIATLVALVGLWALRGGRTPESPWLWRVLTASLVLPFLANSFGWIFTELGRQPWSVFGLLTTDASVSPSVSLAEALISLVSFTLLYGVLAVVDLKLMIRYAKAGPPTEAQALAGLEPPAPPDGPAPPDDPGPTATPATDERPLVFAY